jgi:plasmid stability protein
MTVMIQIRNVPDDVHRTVKARAAKAGLSLSDYLLNSIRRDAERPTLEDIYARLLTREPVKTDIDPVDIIREMRGPI